MATAQPTAPGARPSTGTQANPGAPMRSHPAVQASASAIALWLAFPPADRGYLGWVALAPFFALIRSDRPARSLYLGAWAGGLTFGLLAMSWVGQVSVAGAVLMGLFLSLWWPLFLLTARVGVLRLGLPPMSVAPVVWVALEYARVHILSGFPWYYLAHTQYAYVPMIQVSDLAGAWGLSLVMAAVNACGADLILRLRAGEGPRPARAIARTLATASVLVALVAGYGLIRLGTRSFAPGPRVALLQTDFPQILGQGPRLEEVLRSIDRLVGIAFQGDSRPDLVVWPETSYPIGVVTIEAGLPEGEFASQAKRIDPESTTEGWRGRCERGRIELQRLADQTGTPMLVGAPTYAFRRDGLARYNSAILIRPGSSGPEGYHKQALVPFGEYVPLVGTLPWLLALTPYEDGYVPSLSPGLGPRSFTIQGRAFAPVICFEDTLPGLVRGAFLGDRPPDVLVNLSNDGWFRGSAEHRVHLAISAFRAVECRSPLVRAVNTGTSALIDGDGRILDTQEPGTTGVLNVQVPLDGRGSLYLVAGDWLPASCLLASVAILVSGGLRVRYPARLAHPHSVG